MARRAIRAAALVVAILGPSAAAGTAPASGHRTQTPPPASTPTPAPGASVRVIRVDAEVPTALRESPHNAYVLKLEGIRLPGNVSTTVRIYARVTDTPATLTPADSRYVGSFTLVALGPSETGLCSVNLYVAAQHRLPKILEDLGRPASLPLTLTPLDRTGAPLDVLLTVDRVRVAAQ